MKNRHVFEMFPVWVQKKAVNIFMGSFSESALIYALESNNHNTGSFQDLLIISHKVMYKSEFQKIEIKSRKTIDL